MKKTGLVVFSLVAVWLALYVAIFFTGQVNEMTTVDAGVPSPNIYAANMQRTTGVEHDQPAVAADTGSLIPVTGDTASGRWMIWLVLGAVLVPVVIGFWLLSGHAGNSSRLPERY